jgi:protein-arginine kinase activator protein McsA
VIKLNENIIYAIKDDMEPYLNQKQLIILHKVLKKYCKNEEFTTKTYTRNEINKIKKL